jgi:predicted MFS family arabinose efflux permease
MSVTGLRTVLRAPQVARVLVTSQLGRLPMASAPLALLLFARQSLSLALAGVLVAVYTAAMAFAAPLLARAVDRRRQPPVLHGSALLSAFGFGLVAFGAGGTAVTLLGAALAGAGTPPLEACLRALWPDLVPAAAVPAAYTVDIAVQEVIFVAGPLVTVGAVAVGGPRAGVIAAGLLQLAGVLLFARAPAVRSWRGKPAERHWAGPLRVRRFAVLVVGVVCTGAAFGSIPVVVTGYAEAAGNRSLTGWLLAAQAVGALIGGLLHLRAAPGGRGRLPLAAGALVVGFLPLLAMPGPVPMAVLMGVSGLALPAVLTSVFLSADRLTPAGTAVEAFAWVITAFAVGSAIGSAVTGPIAAAGLRYGFVVAPVATLLAVAAMAAAASPRSVGVSA